MNFTPIPPPIDDAKDHSGVMHIEGPTTSRLRGFIRWSLLIAIVAAIMVGLFLRFGATTAWAFCLVAFMFSYMVMMGRWASTHHE